MTKGEQQPRKKPNAKAESRLNKLPSIDNNQLAQVYGGQEGSAKRGQEEQVKKVT